MIDYTMTRKVNQAFFKTVVESKSNRSDVQNIIKKINRTKAIDVD